MIALVVDGIILGSILSLGAVSLTMVYGIVPRGRFANFAHGDLMAVGAYVAFFLVNTAFAALGLPTGTFGPLSFGLPMLLSLPLAMLVTAGVAVIVDRLVFRPMRQRRYATVMFVIGSLAVAFAIRALLFIIWGPEFHFFTQALRPAMQLPFEVRVKPDQVFILLACLAMVAGLYLFLQRSKIGQALRATADNPDSGTHQRHQYRAHDGLDVGHWGGDGGDRGYSARHRLTIAPGDGMELAAAALCRGHSRRHRQPVRRVGRRYGDWDRAAGVDGVPPADI